MSLALDEFPQVELAFVAAGHRLPLQLPVLHLVAFARVKNHDDLHDLLLCRTFVTTIYPAG